MNTLPLITGHTLDDCIAWRSDGPVSVREFLADAQLLAARLPAGDWLLNVCQDRYRFAVGFAAGLLTGKGSLQPASQSAETLSRIQHDFPGTVSTTRIEIMESARARSLERLTTCAPFTPTAGSIS